MGVSLADALWFQEAACPPGRVHCCHDAGFGPRVAAEYHRRGFDWQQTAIFASAGLDPDDAEPWTRLGLNASGVRTIIQTRSTLEEA